MKRDISVRFWVESGLAVLSVILLLATLLWKDWIEIVFDVDPDAGSGALEWAIVIVAAVLTVVFSALARSEWRRLTARRV